MLSRSDLHAYQTDQAIPHIHEHDRCAVWMDVGGGKSVTTLTALDDMSLVENDVWPALIIGTKRIARSVWGPEIEAWEHLAHLKCSTILGTQDERRAALRIPSDFKTINYQNLAWLVDLLGDDWPFKTVVADEDPRLKSFRLRQGGKNAGALGKVAHTKVKRFIGLTGTPASNGLKDLWGPTWFLDKGARLGRTYSEFEARWFTKGWDGYSVQPMPHAQKEIQDRLRDICLTVDVPAVDEPIKNDIYVDLPPAARRIYDEMERKMYAEIEEIGVEAFSAASRSSKCVAAGTEVLTSRGWLLIENWLSTDLLWDGVEWVSASKLVCNGEKVVIDCWGVRMTPDHRVLTQGGWREAQEVLGAQSRDRHARADVWLPDDHRTCALFGNQERHEDRHVASEVRLRERDCREGHLHTLNLAGRPEVVRLPTARDVARRLGFTRNDRRSSVGDVVQYEVALHKPERQGLEELRRPRYFSLRTVVERLLAILGGHGTDIPKRPDHRADRQQRKLRDRKLSVGHASGAGQQYASQCPNPNTHGRNDCGTSFSGVWGSCADLASTLEKRLDWRKIDRETATVYDIVNAGPRRRFTVRGPCGNPFIVHNCEQIANGAIYTDDAHNWKPVHDAKIEALEAIVTESAGSPILVSYQFKHDLVRLQRAFPRGVVLDDKTSTIDRWNAEMIELLFVHEMSAGHGLNLAKGGHILARVGFTWDLEGYDQIIGRVAPRRQKQAGLNRPVFDHRILARGTVDELKRDRISSKRSVQDILKEALRRRKGRLA